MKKTEFNAMINKIKDGKLSIDDAFTETNDIFTEIITSKVEKATETAKLEFGNSDFIKENEALKEENAKLLNDVTTFNKKNILSKSGINIEKVDVALKLFDVDDISNDEKVSAWVESTKETLPDLFGTSVPTKEPAGLKSVSQDLPKKGGLSEHIIITP